MSTIQHVGDSGFPTGKSFETVAPEGKVRAVIFNQDTGAHFFRDCDKLKDVPVYSDFVVVTVYDDKGKIIAESGEGWNE